MRFGSACVCVCDGGRERESTDRERRREKRSEEVSEVGVILEPFVVVLRRESCFPEKDWSVINQKEGGGTISGVE